MKTSDDLFKMILANSPSSETVFLLLSKMKEDGNLENVIEGCHKALDMFPHDIQIRHLLAQTHFEMDQIPQAEKEMASLTSQMSDLMSIYKLQAEVFHGQNKTEETIQSLDRYLSFHGDDQEALHLLESLRPTKETPDIEKELEPDDKKGLLEIATPTLAEIYFDQGQLQEAIDIYEKVVSQNPDDMLSKQRLEELKVMTLAEEKMVESKGVVDKVRQKKEKMIAVLEAWKANIRGQSEKSAPSS